MGQAHVSDTNRLLGYPADARLLIINADDFGMCHAVNQAIMTTLLDGIVGSTTLMAPCPWAGHAMRFLAEVPVSYPVVYDGAATAPATYGILGMPTGYLIDRSGTVRLVHQGYRKSDGEALRTAIIELLGE